MTTAPAASWQLPLLSPRAWDMLGFALRTWLTAMLALYVSFVLQLESPYWTLLAVWILAVPTPGVMLSKSFYFALGTIAGAFLGIVLMAFFAQTPELFVLALALLVGSVTVASNLLTNFRAYGTVLIGYTAGLVAAGAIPAPAQVFYIGMARGAAILTGLACTYAVNLIFAPHRSDGLARQQLRIILRDAAHRAAYPWTADNETRLQIGRKLVTDLIALNTQIEYAAAESAEFRLIANHARSLLAHIFGIVSARRSLDAHLARRGWPRHEALEQFHTIILEFLSRVPDHLDRNKIDALLAGLGDVQRQLQSLRPEDEPGSSDDLISKRLVIDRMDDLLDDLEGALQDWRDILDGNSNRAPRLTLNFHRDHRAAWINGLRAFLAVCAMGTFWIASAWDRGPLSLVFVAVLISLFSAFPHPERVGWNFFRAGIMAAITGLICKFLVLSMGSGIDYLTVALGLFFIPLAFVMANPAYAAQSLAFAFVFCYIVQPANPMVYDLADSFNVTTSVLVGVLCGTLSYIFIFPANPQAARRYVTIRIRRGVGELARLNPIPYFCFWETRMYDRVIRLYDPENPSATTTNEWLEAGLGAILLGNELLRLRYWLVDETHSGELRATIHSVIDSFTHFFTRPHEAVAQVKSRLPHLAQLDPGPGHPERRCWARVTGALQEIDLYLDHHPKLTLSDN